MTNKKHVNLKDCYCSGVKPEMAYEYVFHINEDEHTTKDPLISGEQLHALAGTKSETHFIRKVTSEGKILVGPNIQVNLTECGIERFIILPFEQETIDLHQCFCDGVKPIITYKYMVKINGQKYSTDKEKISKKELLALVGKDPTKHRLRMFTKNGRVIINDGEIVDLTDCGVERFICEPLDCTEGFIQSSITETDVKFLREHSFTYEVISESNVQWLLIKNYILPRGYNVSRADVAIMIPPLYPTTQLDMIYFYPSLERQDKMIIMQLTPRTIAGKIYQQWSRHRTSANAWDSNNDDIQSHLDLMFNCLKAEFNKR